MVAEGLDASKKRTLSTRQPAVLYIKKSQWQMIHIPSTVHMCQASGRPGIGDYLRESHILSRPAAIIRLITGPRQDELRLKLVRQKLQRSAVVKAASNILAVTFPSPSSPHSAHPRIASPFSISPHLRKLFHINRPWLRMRVPPPQLNLPLRRAHQCWTALRIGIRKTRSLHGQ